MRMSRLGLLAILLAPVTAPVRAETVESATLQMREDEVFWNAIRDSNDSAAFKLFIQAHPESPYVGEARARIEALEAPETEPANDVPEAGSSESTTETAAVPRPDPAAVPTLEELVAALESLGLPPRLGSGEVLDPRMIESYLGDYRRRSGRSSDADVTDSELREVMYFAENRDVFLTGAYEADIIEELLYRMAMVHEDAYGQAAPEDMTELVTALQRHLNLPKTGLLSEEFLYSLASEPVTFPSDEGFDHNQIIGDWVLQDSPAFGSVPHMCYLYPRSDLVTWNGPMLSYFSPAAPRFIYSEGSGSAMRFWFAPDDVFSDAYEVRMVAGNAELSLVRQFDDLDFPLGWTEERDADGYYTGAGAALLKNASGEVRIEGTSHFGIPLTITLSATGFTKAFRTMSKTCAGGELDVWLQ